MSARAIGLLALLLPALVAGCATAPAPAPPSGAAGKASMERGAAAKSSAATAKPAARSRRRSVADVMATLGADAE